MKAWHWRAAIAAMVAVTMVVAYLLWRDMRQVEDPYAHPPTTTEMFERLEPAPEYSGYSNFSPFRAQSSEAVPVYKVSQPFTTTHLDYPIVIVMKEGAVWEGGSLGMITLFTQKVSLSTVYDEMCYAFFLEVATEAACRATVAERAKATSEGEMLAQLTRIDNDVTPYGVVLPPWEEVTPVWHTVYHSKGSLAISPYSATDLPELVPFIVLGKDHMVTGGSLGNTLLYKEGVLSDEIGVTSNPGFGLRPIHDPLAHRVNYGGDTDTAFCPFLGDWVERRYAMKCPG